MAIVRVHGKCLNMVYADSLTSASAPGFKYGKQASSRSGAASRKSPRCRATSSCRRIRQFTQVDAKLKRRAEMKGQGTDPFIDANGCKALCG